MKQYIEKAALMKRFAEVVAPSNNSDFQRPPTWNDAVEIVENFPSADVRPVVRCRDCKFWHDDYVKQNDGTKRKYRETDVDPLGIKNSVTLDIGINCGAMCCVEDGKGWGTNKRVFRQADDFCSRGELRPCSYDEWWGIVDGVYPEEDKP